MLKCLVFERKYTELAPIGLSKVCTINRYKYIFDNTSAHDIPFFSKTEVAASVYRKVLADLSLADIFGQVDLSWLPVIKSAPTVVRMLLLFVSIIDRTSEDQAYFWKVPASVS